MPYIFYDLETSGLEKYYDQFFQFGAIYTDDDLNEIDSINVRCRRLPHIVPSPAAMRVTRMEPSDLEGAELSHYEATQAFLDWCQSKGTCVYAGYNSMDFDERLLRQALFQNLHTPYLTNTKGNQRADIRFIAEAFFHHAPEALKVPDGIGGRHVFRLGPLVRENGYEFSEDVAHDALADVRATATLARHMKEAVPDLWDILIGHASRYAVDDFLVDREAMFASFFYGGRPFSYVVTEAARSAENDKEVGLFDLTYDPEDYIGMTRDELVDVLNASPKVIRTIRTNGHPMLVPLDRPSEFLRGQMPSEQEIRQRTRRLKDANEFRQVLSEALPLRYEPREPSEHVEEQIYDGFPDPLNEALMARFHLTEWEERLPIVQEFTDPRLRSLGIRLLCTKDESLVSEEERAAYRTWMQDRHHTEADVRWRTVQQALQEVDDLERENPNEPEVFNALRQYISGIAVDPV